MIIDSGCFVASNITKPGVQSHLGRRRRRPPRPSASSLVDMGNSSSSSGRHHEETVDYGALVPQGVYTGAQDWNQSVVAQLIASRRLAPFYRPLEEYEESWDDDQILAARKEPNSGENNNETTGRAEPSKSGHSKRPSAGKEFRPEVAVYRGAVECPICFLVSLSACQPSSPEHL